MAKSIFVNLPVADLPRSIKFYEALGFTNNPQFSDETAACMVWSDTIYVMLLTHAKWKTFTTRPIPDTGSSEVAFALARDSAEEVNAMTDTAGREGGIADVNPKQDLGFMFSRSFTDLDGHVWEPVWMNMDAVPEGETPVAQPAA